MTKGGGVECGPAFGEPQAQVSGTVQGVDSLTVGGAYWPEADQKGAEAKTAAAIASCENGPGFSTKKERVSDAVIYSYVAGDAGVGWYAVVTGGQGVALLNVSENGVARSRFTADQLEALASAAQARLDRYATATSAPTKTGSSGPKAIDEVMQVSGPAPVPASKYFVAASQWSDPLLGPGGKTYAGQGNPDDSLGDIGVFCETKDFLSGFGGRLGEVEIQSGPGDGNVIGHQRVRIDDADTSTPAGAAMAKTAVDAQLADEQATLVRGCTDHGDKVTATNGPTEGTFLLTKKVTGEATGTDYRWVGVAPLTSPGAWTTIVFHGTGDGQGFQGTKEQGFAELDRLLALARQK